MRGKDTDTENLPEGGVRGMILLVKGILCLFSVTLLWIIRMGGSPIPCWKKQQTYVAPGLEKNGQLEKRCRYFTISLFEMVPIIPKNLRLKRGANEQAVLSITNAYIILGNYKVITIWSVNQFSIYSMCGPSGREGVGWILTPPTPRKIKFF